MENRAAKRLALIVGAVAVVGVGAYLPYGRDGDARLRQAP